MKLIAMTREVPAVLAGLAGSMLVALTTGPAAYAQEACMNDVADFNHIVCTANDVRVSRINVLGGPTECTEGEQVTLENLEAELLSGAKQRYDIGVYIATDGGDAKVSLSGENDGCFRDILEPVGGSGFDDLDGDDCGDIRKRITETKILDTVTLTCADTDDDEYLDVGACVSWDNNRKGTCSGEVDAIPGTPSKCRCQTVRVGDIGVTPASSITVYKMARLGGQPFPTIEQFDFYFDGVFEAALTPQGAPMVKAPLAEGTYTISERWQSDLQAGLWDLQGIECENNAVPATIVIDNINQEFTGGIVGSVVIELQKDEDVECTFTNILPEGPL